MSVLPERETSQMPDWDDLYRRGTPAWETNHPAAELVRAVEQEWIRPCSMLELGCGSGADAVYLAQQGFEVTAVDCAAIALERAHLRAEQQEAMVRFVLDDVFDFAANEGAYDLIYDAGFYHCVRQYDLQRHLDMLWRITRPGSIYFALVGAEEGAAEDGAEHGPPQVSEDDIYGELGRIFEFVRLEPFRFESPMRDDGYPGWSCLMKRPETMAL